MIKPFPLLERVPAHRRRLFRRVVAFGAVSVAATIADLGLFNVLVIGHLAPLLVATTLAYTLGTVTSYVLNRRFTFDGGRDNRVHEVGIFIGINLVGLALNDGMVALFAGWLGRGTLILNVARILAGALTWTFKFVTMQRWVFPSRDSHPLSALPVAVSPAAVSLKAETTETA
jgi:putative flippase GtrA